MDKEGDLWVLFNKQDHSKLIRKDQFHVLRRVCNDKLLTHLLRSEDRSSTFEDDTEKRNRLLWQFYNVEWSMTPDGDVEWTVADEGDEKKDEVDPTQDVADDVEYVP